MRLAAFAVLPLLLTVACGDQGPPARLGPATGRTLTYAAERIDHWPDEEYGYGGTLRTEVLYRTRCIDAVSGKRGTFDVRVLAVEIEAPDRFGVRIDTATPATEDGDRFGAEEIVRELLEQDGRITLAVSGVPLGEVPPDQHVRDRLLAWGGGYDGLATPAIMLLDEVLDGPRLVARWSRAVSLLLPPEPRPADGATWTLVSPPFASPAGSLAAELACTFTVLDERRCRIEARGPMRVDDETGAQLDLASGEMEAVLDLDRVAGTVTRYHETITIAFARQDGTEVPLTWDRILTLVD